MFGDSDRCQMDVQDLKDFIACLTLLRGVMTFREILSDT